MTNAIDRLERDRLVRRRINPNDGRGVLAAITKRGRDLAHEATVALNETVFTGLELSQADADTLSPSSANCVSERAISTDRGAPPGRQTTGLTREAGPGDLTGEVLLSVEKMRFSGPVRAVGPAEGELMGEFDDIDFFRGNELIGDPYPYFDLLRGKCPVRPNRTTGW